MATAGFTLMTESICLKKPFLALPMRGQFEQELNGLMLDMAGYGMNIRNIGIGERAVGNFLQTIPVYKEKLMALSHWNNNLIMNKLKELLDNNCAAALHYHRNRSV